MYRQIYNIRPILVENKITDHSDVVGASPVGAAPTSSSWWTQHLASMDCVEITNVIPQFYPENKLTHIDVSKLGQHCFR